MVVTLLAILELARLKVVRVLQSPDGETLFITQAAGVTIESARQLALTAGGEAKQVPVDQNDGEETDAGEDADADADHPPHGILAEEPEETLAESSDQRSRKYSPTCPRKYWPTRPPSCPKKHSPTSPTRPSSRSPKKRSRKRMSKRKKTTQPNGEGVVSVPVEGDLTSPDWRGTSSRSPAETPRQTNGETSGEHVFDSAEPDTQVGPAPTADSWDGPTNVGTRGRAGGAGRRLGQQRRRTDRLGRADGATEAKRRRLTARQPQTEPRLAPVEGDGAQAEGEPLPEVAPGRLESIIESLLFASDRPLTLAELKRLVGERDGGKLTAALEALRGAARRRAASR